MGQAVALNGILNGDAKRKIYHRALKYISCSILESSTLCIPVCWSLYAEAYDPDEPALKKSPQESSMEQVIGELQFRWMSLTFLHGTQGEDMAVPGALLGKP